MNRIINLMIAFSILFWNFNSIQPEDTSDGWTLLSRPQRPTHIISLAVSRHDPLYIYALTEDQKLFRSANQGDSWALVEDTPVLSSIEADAGDSSRLYGIEGTTKVFLSEDAGNSWRITFEAEPYQSISSVQSNASNLVYFTYDWCSDVQSSCIFISKDGGVIWTGYIAPGKGYQIRNLYINDLNPELIYLTEHGPFYYYSFRSKDGGQTWEEMDITFTDVTSDPGDELKMFASIDLTLNRPFTNPIIYSNDSGATWQACSYIPGSFYTLIHTGDTLIAYTISNWEKSNNLSVYKSNDGCNSWWKSVEDGLSNLRSGLFYNGNNKHLFLLGHSGIFRSLNFGASWHAINSGLYRYDTLSQLLPDPSHNGIIHGIIDGNIIKSVDEGKNWSDGITNRYVEEILNTESSQNTYSTIMGRSGDRLIWVSSETGLFHEEKADHPFDDIVSGLAIADGTIYAAGYRSREWYFGPSFYISINFNHQFLTMLSDQTGSTSDYFLIGDSDLYMLQGYSIIRSIQYPREWKTVLKSDTGGLVSLSVLSRDQSTGFAVISDRDGNTNILRSLDCGLTWQDWSEGLQNIKIAKHDVVAAGFLYACLPTDQGVFCRGENSPSWRSVGLDGQKVTALAYHHDSSPILIASTESGVWQKAFNLALLPFISR